jgi:hypothetical protein
MPTTHRLSFPTCLSHPRSIHLHCHLDSPSAANLPCLGLQQQTGLEISELCGSYRVPSRSSLLPLCTLSPGEVAHRPGNLSLQPQPPLSPGESVVYAGQQATCSQALHDHHNQLEHRHEHPKMTTDRCNNITRLSNYGTLWFSQPTTQDGFLVLVSEMRKGTQRFHTEA